MSITIHQLQNDYQIKGGENCIHCYVLATPIPIVKGSMGINVKNVRKIYAHISVFHDIGNNSQPGEYITYKDNLILDVSRPRLFKKSGKLRKYPTKSKVWLTKIEFSKVAQRLK